MKYANSTGYRQMALHRALADSKKSRKTTIRYQATKKNGDWGAVREEPLRFYDTPEEAIKAWEELNPGKHFRLVEEA